ncbi:lamin tail domain-containing protein [Aquimarina sp. RZ0]|uniref:lamin tail domain-containing protein n=1 Tax=Aquimarina sp. RZ0 TaxID=2607730 RepID=UPI0011F23786|nr:lamin tail domain-containing protein [Aquimarina sp. RZ0]KAA1245499.1 T9SS type A sorting domain-containing protein [Aquimarina sp. RZ0]
MKHLSIIFYFLILTTNAQNIVINELQAKNVITLQENCDGRGCPDWIELHNTTNANIDISNYFLSDDPNDVMKWQMPAGTVINANGFLLLFGENAFSTTAIKVNFNLSTSGETLVLSDASGTEIQQLTYPAIQNDISYGRIDNGTYTFMTPPSPRDTNPDTTAFEYLDSNLTVSLPSGLYPSSQPVELTHSGTGTIYYTLDGTTPTINSTPYTGPITISNNTALKAIVIENANLFSIVENRSYIIGATHELPIVLLTSDNSSKTVARRNKEVIDGRVEFNFIETDGTTVISQYANFRESGNASRALIPQLNGKIEASKLYGDSDFDHKMFPNKTVDEFGSIYLRNSSQDWFYTHLRDAFVSRLMGSDNLTNFSFEGYRPAVLYVNSIYQGIINIREDDDNDYIRHNFNLENGEFVIRGSRSNLFIKPDAPLPTDREALNSIINFNNYTNIRMLINYSDLGERGFNWWEDLSGKTGQRYHYLIHDFDFSFGRGFSGVSNLTDPMEVSSLLDNEIDTNPAYRSEALQFVAAALNHIYNTSRVIAILDEMEAELENEIPAHGLVNTRLNMERPRPFNTPPFANLTEWKQNMEDLRNNIRNRVDDDIFNRIQTEYSLDTPIDVSYSSSDINQGFVRVHEIKIQEETATGTYFSNIPLKLTAEALPGFRFVRWEGDATGNTVDIAPVFSANAAVTAIFEPITAITNDAVINEVQGKNDSTITDENGEYDDWIEIYNPGSTPINLAGLYFSDSFSDPLKWQIPDTDASKTTVAANGYLLLWADNDPSQGENHLGFKLKGSDQIVVTYSDGITEKQRIEFTDIESDQSYGAENDVATNFILFTAPTPNATNKTSTLDISDFEKDSFSVYPNPTRYGVTINTPPSQLSTLNWKIYTINGSLLDSGTGNKVAMQDLSSGFYFIKINNKTTLKIIKQ